MGDLEDLVDDSSQEKLMDYQGLDKSDLIVVQNAVLQDQNRDNEHEHEHKLELSTDNLQPDLVGSNIIRDSFAATAKPSQGFKQYPLLMINKLKQESFVHDDFQDLNMPNRNVPPPAGGIRYDSSMRNQ